MKNNTYDKCHEDFDLHFVTEFILTFSHELFLSSLSCTNFYLSNASCCWNLSSFFLDHDLSLSVSFQKLFEILEFHVSFILLCKLRARTWSTGRREEKSPKKNNKTVNTNKTPPKREKFLDSDVFLSESFWRNKFCSATIEEEADSRTTETLIGLLAFVVGTGIGRLRVDIEVEYWDFPNSKYSLSHMKAWYRAMLGWYLVHVVDYVNSIIVRDSDSTWHHLCCWW